MTAAGRTRATVIIPTTGDRGPLLDLSVESVLRQTMKEIEVFIVGDGVDDSSRHVIEEICDRDSRVQFVDRPKQTSRGELLRHELLTEHASGDIVAYICDRDLWFSNHLDELEQLLATSDIACTLHFDTYIERPPEIFYHADLPALAALVIEKRPSLIARLSTVGHTRDAYLELPHGWRETPPGLPTDNYMWNQFLDQPGVEAMSSAEPTIIYLKRGDYPGLPTPQRRELLEYWNDRLTTPGGEQLIRREVLTQLKEQWRTLESRTVRRRVGRSLRRAGLRR